VIVLTRASVKLGTSTDLSDEGWPQGGSLDHAGFWRTWSFEAPPVRLAESRRHAGNRRGYGDGPIRCRAVRSAVLGCAQRHTAAGWLPPQEVRRVVILGERSRGRRPARGLRRCSPASGGQFAIEACIPRAKG